MATSGPRFGNNVCEAARCEGSAGGYHLPAETKPDGWVEKLRGQRNQRPPWAGAYRPWAKGDVDRPLSENGPAGLCTGADSGPQKSSLQTVDCSVSEVHPDLQA